MATVHTGVGQGAVRPSGRSVQPQGLSDVAYVKAGQYATSDSFTFSDNATQRNLNPVINDSLSFVDIESISGSYGGNTDTYVESVFGAVQTATYVETRSISDSPEAQILNRIDSVPLTDNGNVIKATNTETLPVSDTATHP